MIRETKETRVEAVLSTDGGAIDVATGVGFLDHMVEQWAFHGGFGVTLKTQGDLRVDTHHTVEDTAIGLGLALSEALGERTAIRRFGWAYAPLDEALARAVVDLVRRPYSAFRCHELGPMVGTMPGDMVAHFFRSMAASGLFTLHIDVLQGENDHHKVEAAFKAFGLAAAAAAGPSTRGGGSTKGVM
jgi:imidazoleglycerol-phosphate dehydratase